MPSTGRPWPADVAREAAAFGQAEAAQLAAAWPQSTRPRAVVQATATKPRQVNRSRRAWLARGPASATQDELVSAVVQRT